MRYPDSIQLSEIRRFSKVLADAAASSDLATPVPTCPGWSIDDLVWHMTEVQDFWTFIIASRPSGPKNYERPERTRGTRLVANFRNATVGLLAALETCSAEETAWSWAPDQTVGFTLRRQVHEALIHCIDGQLAIGADLPQISPQLAADGVDEVLYLMVDQLLGVPVEDDEPGETAGGRVILHATDTDDRWTVALGHGSCAISGNAFSLYQWLWGRANSFPLSITGDIDQASRLREVIATKSQ